MSFTNGLHFCLHTPTRYFLRLSVSTSDCVACHPWCCESRSLFHEHWMVMLQAQCAAHVDKSLSALGSVTGSLCCMLSSRTAMIQK